MFEVISCQKYIQRTLEVNSAVGCQESPPPLHIFYVQSFLSLAVCRAIITLKCIAGSDVCLILDRGMAPIDGLRSAVAPTRWRAGLRQSFRAVLDNRRIRRDNAEFLFKLVAGRPFEFYVNRMNYLFLDIVRAATGFSALHLYEEGLAAYYRQPGDNSRYGADPRLVTLRRAAIGRLAGYRGASRRHFYDLSYKHAYAAGKRAFLRFPRRISVDLATELMERITHVDYSTLPRDTVLVVMPLANALRKTAAFAEGFVRSLSAVVRHVDGRRPIRFQPHPDHYHDAEFWRCLYQRVEAQTGLDIHAHVVEGIPLEGLAAHRDDVGFCVVISSTAVYAHGFGREVVSLSPGVFGETHPLVKEFRMVCPTIQFNSAMGDLPKSAFLIKNAGSF